MAIVRWDPARELDSLQGDVNRLFDSFFGRREGSAAGASRRWIPAMDLVETEDHLVLRADLPGLDRDDVEIEAGEGESGNPELAAASANGESDRA